jgi:hypothetical protein
MKPFFSIPFEHNWGFDESWWMELDAVAELVIKLKLLVRWVPLG